MLDAALFAGNATEGIEGENHAEAQTWKKQPGSFGAHCEFGGPTRIRTWNQQIMSPNRDSEPEEDKGLDPAKSSKVLQNPQPRRNKTRKRHDE